MREVPAGSAPTLRVVRAVGHSMAPLIKEGAEVGVTPVVPERLVVGDLAAFVIGEKVCVHRVIGRRIDGDRLLLREKGDANATATWIAAEQVIGRAAWVAHEGRLRRLDDPAAARATARLAAASRAEADLAERVSRFVPWKLQTRPGARLRAALRPLKALAFPLIAVAYPEVHLDEGPELDRLLACWREDIGLPAPSLPAAGDQDGLRLLQGATWHGIVPAVLRTAGGSLAPEIRVVLEQYRVRNALGRLRSLATLREAVGALAAAQVDYVVLKGPALAGLHSGSERASTDLDLLVAKPDVARAATVLAAAGYGLRDGTVARRRFHFHALLPPRHRGRVPIELHWDLVDRANLNRVDAAEVLARRREMQADGAIFAVPAPEDEFLYLALHAAKHGVFNRRGLEDARAASWFCRPLLGNRLLWFEDLHFLIVRRGDTLDWGVIRERAAQWNIGEEVGVVLGVMELLLPGGGFGSVRERLGLAPFSDVRPPSGRPPRESRLKRWILRWAMRAAGGLYFRPVRLAGLARVLVPPAARLRAYWRPTSRAPLPLLYIRHPFHVVRKVLRA